VAGKEHDPIRLCKVRVQAPVQPTTCQPDKSRVEHDRAVRTAYSYYVLILPALYLIRPPATHLCICADTTRTTTRLCELRPLPSLLSRLPGPWCSCRPTRSDIARAVFLPGADPSAYLFAEVAWVGPEEPWPHSQMPVSTWMMPLHTNPSRVFLSRTLLFSLCPSLSRYCT
jgi:hypothetical protein